MEKNHTANPDWLNFHVANYWQHWIIKAEPHLEDSPWTTKICQQKSSCWVLAKIFLISHTLFHSARLHGKSTGSAAGSADSASKHNCSSLCPSASFLPSLSKLVFPLVPEISPLPPYLTIPQDRFQLAIVTSNMHRPSTSKLQPSTTWNPFNHTQRQFQNKASLTVHPLPSSQDTASSPAPFSPMASCYRISLGWGPPATTPDMGKAAQAPKGRYTSDFRIPPHDLAVWCKRTNRELFKTGEI